MKPLAIIFVVPLIAVSSCDRNKKPDIAPSQPTPMTSLPDNPPPQKDTDTQKSVKAVEESASEGETPNAGHANILPKQIVSQRKSSNFEVASVQFGELLKSSECIGKPLSAIKAEFGEPDAESANSMSYRFDAAKTGIKSV